MLGLLLTILIIVIIAAVLDYVQGRIPMPPIGHTIARIIIWVAALLAILSRTGLLSSLGA
jgi:hypothetical protein